MIEHSSKLKGYLPMKSGPNMMGFDMGKSGSLMEMMQTGGQPSSGAAMLARSRQRQSDTKRLEEIQREEAERQKKGGFFGNLVGTGLALVGGAVAGPVGAGIGKAIGTGLGQKFGAGKPVDYDTGDTVFAQQAFRDVDEASEDFNQGILSRSILEGAKTGLTAGLTPGGGIYGSLNPLKSAGRANISKMISGVGLKGFTGGQGLLSFSQPEFVQATSAMPQALSQSEIASRAMDYSQRYGDQASQLFMDDFGIQIPGAQTGGLIEYQNGGSVNIQQILQDAGITATPQQLAMFEQFDPTQLSRATEAISGSLMGMTGGQGLASAGSGFGAQTSAIAEAVSGSQRSLDQQREDQQRAFESQTLGQAASLTDQGVEFGEFSTFTPPQTVSSLPTTNEGPVMFNNQRYNWNPRTNSYELTVYNDDDFGDYDEYDEFG